VLGSLYLHSSAGTSSLCSCAHWDINNCQAKNYLKSIKLNQLSVFNYLKSIKLCNYLSSTT
jgi:hypothetical protein